MDWSGVDERMAREILRQGELYLQGLTQLAIAGDQRAATLGGLFSAAAAATATGVGAVLSSSTLSDDRTALLTSLAAMTLFFVAAAALCAVALWPTKFQIAGNLPSNWWPDNVSRKPLVEALGGESENYEERIRFNLGALARSTVHIKMALTLGSVAAPLGAIVFFVVRYWPRF